MDTVVEIVVAGAAGRMGRRIVALADADTRVRVVGALELPGHEAIGADVGAVAGVGESGVSIADELGSQLAPGRVVVEFSSPQASLSHLRETAASATAMVIGTTGFSEEERAEAERLAKQAPTLIAPNMSLGVNVLLGLVEDAAKRLGEAFDCEIVELHHNRKKDAPSGTALALAAAAARGKGLDPDADILTQRSGLVGERPQREIGVLALRGGDAAGDHTVMLLGNGERLELSHRASSRDCLAAGAISAALWLAGRPAGLYSMRDVIA